MQRREATAVPGADSRHADGRDGGLWGGEALMEQAGSLLSSAREGARSFVRDAGASVSGMGSSSNGRQSAQQAGQHVSGVRGAPEWQGQSFISNGQYEVTFGEGRLGFTLLRDDRGKGVVYRVNPDSLASSLGVRRGDYLVGVNKRSYDSYDEVMAVLPTLPRPVLLSFTRPAQASVPEVAAGQMARPVPAYKMQGTQAESRSGPLDWLSRLGDDQRPSASLSRPDGARGLDDKTAFAQAYGGLLGWSYYGTAEGVEPASHDVYTEHVMCVQWGTGMESMTPWMVARRYREFDALDKDIREAFPHLRNAFPRLPPKELFKTSPEVVARRAQGLEQYMLVLIRNFPSVLESPHMDSFLTISERLSTMSGPRKAGRGGDGGGHGAAASAHGDNAAPPSRSSAARSGGDALVGTDYILHLMTSQEAYNAFQEKRLGPMDEYALRDAEDLVGKFLKHVGELSPTAHLISDAELYGLVERCQQCWPLLKATAAGAAGGNGEESDILPRALQCDEDMENGFAALKAELAKRGYQGS